MKLKKESEKIAVLLHAIAHPDRAKEMLQSTVLDVATSAPYRSEVFVKPGEAFGESIMLFSSVTNAAYFLLRHTKKCWTKTCRNLDAAEYEEMTRLRVRINQFCNDERYHHEWWFARDTTFCDGSNDHIDNMKNYDIIDMRTYNYKNE